MKSNLIIIITLVLFSSCGRKQFDYDVIIVGGGLSGIAASTELDEQSSSLIIEKESQLGGRVLTHNYNNRYFYDLGAVYLLDSSYFDELPIKDSIIDENNAIGIWSNGLIYEGYNFKTALKNYHHKQRDLIDSIYENNTFNFKGIDPLLLNALNTNIKSVFPGSIFDYNLPIQQYAKVRYNSSHFVKGNQAVKDKLLEHLKSEVLLNTTVKSVEESTNGGVIVTYENSGKIKMLSARKVIVSTNALVAKVIIKEQTSEFQSFINSINYAPYISIAIGIKDTIAMRKLAYVIPINKGFSAVLKQKTVDKDVTIFQLYVASEDIPLFGNMLNLKNKAFELLHEIWSVDSTKTLFFDEKYWPTAGVLADDHYKKDWNKFNFKASKNVFISGDYCSLRGVPYGMIPAMQTGKEAAQKVNKELNFLTP